MKPFAIKHYFGIIMIDVLIAIAFKTNLISKLARLTQINVLIKWTDMSDATGTPHLNLTGFLANTFFVIAFVTIFRIITIKITQETHLKDSIHNKSLFNKKISLCNSMQSCLLFTVPAYMVSSEYHRYLSAMLVLYYIILAEYEMFDKKIIYKSRILLNVIVFFLVILYAALYMYSNRGYDVFAVTYQNMLFNTFIK